MRTLSRRLGGRPRRSPRGVPVERRTRRDLLVAAVIAVVMILVASIVLLTGSAARSDFGAADAEQPEYSPAGEAPTMSRFLWSHESAGSGAPLTTKGNLVTVDPDGQLIGRDAGSGEEKWSYTHKGSLCAAAYYSDSLVAAFDGADGCSDVTAIGTTAQEYTSTRQSAFPDTMQLDGTWKHMLALSPQRLEIWRDDLVRTIEYGAVDAPQEPDAQPRSDCSLATADLTDARFAVTERCPTDDSVRLTLAKTVPEDNRIPEEIASAATGANGLWIIDMTDEGVLALQNVGPRWSVEWFTSPTVHSTVLDLPSEPTHKPSPETLSGDRSQARWFDGATTHAFDLNNGRHTWSTRGTTGPGHSWGYARDPEAESTDDWVILPVDRGFVVNAHDTGAESKRLPATSVEGTPERSEGNSEDHEVEDGDVTGLAQVGDILYERRAGSVYAYKIIS